MTEKPSHGFDVRPSAEEGRREEVLKLVVRAHRLDPELLLETAQTIWDGVSTTTRRLWAFEMALGIDGTANVVWSRSLDAANDDEGYAVQQLTDKTLVIGGTSQSLGAGPTSNLWISRTQQDGAITFPAASGVTVTSLSGQIYQTMSASDPDGGPAPIPVLSSDTAFTSTDTPVSANDDPLTLLDTSVTPRALGP